MIDIKFNYKLLNIVVLIIIFLISIISNLDSPFLGNGNEKLFWSRLFTNNQFILWDRIYDIYIQPIYHTTFYIHLISFIENYLDLIFISSNVLFY